jgi:hypothetical protein
MDRDEQPLHLLQIALSSFIRPISIPFRFPPIVFTDLNGSPWTVENREGVTLITADGLSQKPKKEKFNAKITVPNDSAAPREVELLSAELTQLTADLYDIDILELRLTWGLKQGKLPSLIGSEGRFVPNCPSYGSFLHDIVFFLALKTCQTVEAGKCFSRRGICIGADMTCVREKIVIHRIKKLAHALKSMNFSEFVIYIKSRVEIVCPNIMFERVPVCRNCFSLYARERVPSRQLPIGPLKFVRPMVAETHFDDSNESIFFDNRPRSRPSPSGLSYVQSTSFRGIHRAQQIYRSSPFPAFLQHPV